MVEVVILQKVSINPAKLAGWGDEVRLTTFIPLSLVDQNNKMTFDNGSTVTFDKKKMKELSTVMNSFIANKALAKSKVNPDKDLQSLSEGVYESLYLGSGSTMNEFLNYASSEDVLEKYPTLFAIDKKVEGDNNISKDTTIIEVPKENVVTDGVNTDTNSKIKYLVTKENGEDGLSINGKFNKWESIEAADAVKDLPPKQKLDYDKWKENKAASGSKKNIPLFKRKTKEDVITPAIKNTIKSINSFGKNITENEGDFGSGT